MDRFVKANGLAEFTISQSALNFLTRYEWPGNVRELQNYVERAIVLAEQTEISDEDLPQHVRGLAPVTIGRTQPGESEDLCASLVAKGILKCGEDSKSVHREVVGTVERELILQVLRQCQGVQTRTATRLGINRNTLHKKIEDYGLQEESR